MSQNLFTLINDTLSAAGKMQRANWMAAMRSMELMTNSYSRLWGLPAKEVLPPDKRFQDGAWNENFSADLLKQTYLISAQWLSDTADSLEEVNPDLHQRTKFWVNQLTNTLSPTNYVLTNPTVLQETVRTGGNNLVRGMQNLLSDMQSGRISQVPEDSFRVGKDLAITPGEVVYRNPLIELIQYYPTTGQVHEIPILMISPWINKFYVMDMRPENSMFKYLVDSGFTVFAISWKNPDKAVLDLKWDDYMDLGPLDALRVIREITGANKVNAAGYCLGGIILEVTLAYLAKTGEEWVNAATYFATHQDFKNAGDVSVFISEPEVQYLEWLMDVSGGYLDGRNLAATFNMLRSNDLLWNYVIHNYLLGKQPPAFDLLYWNNDGTRAPGKVHSFLVREFFLQNKLMHPDALRVKGVGVDLGLIETPSYAVAAAGDHIVPWQGTYLMRDLLGAPVRFVLTTGGHIAGVINK